MEHDAMLYEAKKDNRAHCHLCAHHCMIDETAFGFCGVRQNIGGRLYSRVYGRPVARHIDPIEKKPLYHFLPGSRSYSVATAGCNFHCGFCQNWQISQIAETGGSPFEVPFVPPEEIAEAAANENCRSIAYTYTEPTIYFEYALNTAETAAEKGLYNVFVTNGYMTRKALDAIAPFLDAANVDLKSFREEYYRHNCEAHLKPVLDSIGYMKKLGIWVEVTTLIIPGENDADEELDAISRFIADTGKEIPWHISRFHPGYRFSNRAATPEGMLFKARDIGYRNGLRYIYLGNIPTDNDTACPRCQAAVIRRNLGRITEKNMAGGKCGACGAEVDGVWT